MRLAIVTGMSGAGKSHALNCLEDMGFFCVDNLPPSLMETFIQLIGNKFNKVALGVDIRGGEFFGEIFAALMQLQLHDAQYDIIFLDASDAVLVKRFKETRRIHPMGEGMTLQAAIDKERQLLQRIKENASYIVDTSSTTLGQLKNTIASIFADDEKPHKFPVSVISFGYKYGIPSEADLVFDVRFVTNPFYIESMRDHTGLDEDVHDFVMSFPETTDFLDKLYQLIDMLIPQYQKEGKGQVVIAMGCTGGQHRSVALAQELARHLQNDSGYSVRVDHRDMRKGQQE